jgi:hypothetical protein
MDGQYAFKVHITLLSHMKSAERDFVQHATAILPTSAQYTVSLPLF